MALHDYFKSYEGYFWQWEEEGEVIGIPNGSTIAYKQFVIELLENLSDQGMPPFGSLLLAIIATNPNGENSLNAVYALIDKKLGSSNSTREPLNTAISFLKLLSHVPKKYKVGKNRLLLLQTLFSNSHNSISTSKSKDILDFYKTIKNDDGLFTAEKVFHANIYNSDFRVIALLVKKFPNVTTIVEKLAGLPVIEEELTVVPSHSELIEKSFIQDLIENNKTFHVGSLIKRLWSGLNIPFHNVLPSEQPIGGVSDLTNKGQFDRLLISEFANDDLIFLSRLANNEALYINREIPPQNNSLERIILIDVSIKNWGTPKIIAHALLLSIAKHPKTDIHCSAFAVGNSYQPLKFETIDDVIAGLQLLDPCLHPAKGLEDFFKEYGSKKNIEVFFISSGETFHQPCLHRIISDHYLSFNYWIHTDDRGKIDLYKRQQNSKKYVQHIQLPLSELWTKPAAIAQANIISETDKNYPILFADPMYSKKFLSAKDGEVFLISSEKSLLRLFNGKVNEKKGWQMIYEDLPPFDEAEIGIIENGNYLLLLFKVSNRKLTIINLATDYIRSVHFNEWRSSIYKQFVFYNGRFYFSSTFPMKHWTFALEEEIIVNSYDNIPAEIIERHKEKEKEIKTHQASLKATIFKNITSIFINEVNNLVFNIHELRLTDHNIIKLEKTGFLKKKFEAVASGKNEFVFLDGSTITINKSGMLILKSSDPSNSIIYVPSVLGGSLGAASKNAFAGNAYYYLPGTGRESLSTTSFWEQYMMPFIENVKARWI